MADDLAELILADAAGWRSWLEECHGCTAGVWLVLAKKGTVRPTSLRYDDALDEALCYGWIDGQARSRDATTYYQRFTPRRSRGSWSARNVGIVVRLVAEDRMRPAGLAEVERARADGRWDVAYAGPASIEVPSDLAEALAADPAAQAMFDILSSQNRYAILHRVGSAKRPETRLGASRSSWPCSVGERRSIPRSARVGLMWGRKVPGLTSRAGGPPRRPLRPSPPPRSSSTGCCGATPDRHCRPDGVEGGVVEPVDESGRSKAESYGAPLAPASNSSWASARASSARCRSSAASSP